MQIYLVGGAVRNQLMGIAPIDRDYVVVGSTVQQMLDLGYQQVGAHFPVFLHPETKQEYALARTEQSCGAGHTDFMCSTENVSLEQDLYRRDFTMNAIAQTEDGRYIDPFNGRQDINWRILRHVSLHFAEDPLRVLRGARFAAQYGLIIAPETMLLMRSMVADKMLNTLPVERIKKEFDKALMSDNFSTFCSILFEIGAMQLFTELNIVNLQTAQLPFFTNQYPIDLQASRLRQDLLVDCYSTRIIRIALHHATIGVNCFPSKHLIGARLHKLSAYIYKVVRADMCNISADEVLRLLGNDLINLIDILNQDATLTREQMTQICLNFGLLFAMQQQIDYRDFKGCTVRQIKSAKLSIVENILHSVGYMCYNGACN